MILRLHMPHRLLDICLSVVVRHIGKATSFEGLPDDLCQKLMSMIKGNNILTQSTLKLFTGCKLSKLDLKMKMGGAEGDVSGIQITDDWLNVTRGEMALCLESLDLSGSAVTDEGVASLNHLSILSHLNLSRCQLITGSFLTKLSCPLLSLTLERCSALDVRFALNQLTSFPSLRFLTLAGCTFSDIDLAPLATLPLTSLDLSNNPQLTPSTLQLLSALTNLKDLSISHCTHLSYDFRPLSALTSLKKLTASSCELTDDALIPLEFLTSLETLVLSSNKFTDAGMPSLGKLHSLTALDLSLCINLTDKGLLPLKGLEHLKQLHLNFCRNLTNSALVGFTQLTSLGIIGCDRLLIQVQQRQRPVVLLAEDNLMQSQLIKRVFERYHFDVATACNGQMALDMYKSNPGNFVLVLMDVVMPIMDGLTSTMLIRKYEWEQGLKRTPIIMQTADVREAHRQLCLEAGCDDFVTKPLDKRVVDLARELIGS